MAFGVETSESPPLGFVGVDGEHLEVAASGMGDVIAAACDRAAAPAVDDVERERYVRRDRRMKRRWRPPRAVTNARDHLAPIASRRQRQWAAVAGDHVPIAGL